jgi:catechol 2,3-dioxygenase-like lactoylglutathione lyase family enzyme
MNTTAAGTTTAKFHSSLNVSDLTRSVKFYRTLFGLNPAKRAAITFGLDEPPLVLTLIPMLAPATTWSHC